jgi:hypothetical protein
LALLVAIGFVVVRAFQPPSAEKLFKDVDKYMADDTPDLWKEARDPIKEFLARYPDDPKASRIRDWSNQIEGHEQESALKKRMSKERKGGKEFVPDGDQESLAFAALRYQDFADWWKARERWQELKEATEKDAEQHGWLALAEWKINNLKSKPPKSRNSKETHEETGTRKLLVQKKLDEARKLAADKMQVKAAGQIASDIVDLYGNTPEVKDQVDRAKELREKLREEKKDK